MSIKQSAPLEKMTLRVKQRTLRDAQALATQHDDDLPDILRAAFERGLPIEALLAGPDTTTQMYGVYTQQQLVQALYPTFVLLYGFYAQHGGSSLPPPVSAHPPAPPSTPEVPVRAPAAPLSPPPGAAGAFPDHDASSALLGLGIDIT